MNKALIATLMLTLGTAMAGEPTVITCTAPAPAPQMQCPLTFELAGVYAFANNELLKGGSGQDVDVYGGDITAVYNIDPFQSLNLRFGYTYGDDSSNTFITKHDTDVHNFYLMPGYRVSWGAGEKLGFYAGVNAGVANLSIKEHTRSPWGSNSAHDSAFGFAYSAEIGVRYRLSDCCDLFAAYQFVGSTASPDLQYGNFSRSARNQTYNAVRAGVSFAF